MRRGGHHGKGGGVRGQNVSAAGKPTFEYSRRAGGLLKRSDEEEITFMLSRASRARSEAAFHDLVSFLDHLDLLDLAMTLPAWSAYFDIQVKDIDPHTAEQLRRASQGGSE